MRIFSHVGEVEERAGRSFVKTKRSEEGYAVFGPYENIGPGKYSVTFEIVPEEIGDGSEVCCVVDVHNHPNILFRKELTANELQINKGIVEIEFINRAAGFGEYRVFTTGKTALSIAYDRTAVAVLDEASDLSFLISGNSSEHAKNLYHQHYGRISYLMQFGANFELGKRIVARYNEIRIYISILPRILIYSLKFSSPMSTRSFLLQTVW